MSGQQWDPDTYERSARFVSEHGVGVVELLDPKPGERILDLGCGDGALTERIVAAGCQVVGIDGSVAQVAAAQRRGLDARVVSAEAMAFEAEFDAVFSNAVLHWIPNAQAVLKGVHRALRSGGRFVGEFGGHGNVQAIRNALADALGRRRIDAAALDPWYYPTDDEYGRLLEEHGFTVSMIRLFPRPTSLPGDMSDWILTFAQPFLAPIDEGDRARLLNEVSESLRPQLYDPQSGWKADYVRLRFSARR